MYIPKSFGMKDEAEALAFIRKHSFGILVSTADGLPLATHIPFRLMEEEGRSYLFGHIALANPQTQSLANESIVLAIFQGPHAYVSSSWYARENASTWNYLAVHVYGKIELISGDAVKHDLGQMVAHYEQAQTKPRFMESMSDKLVRNLLAEITPFRLHIERIEGAAKMSQNRTDTDYGNIVAHLNNGTDEEKRVGEIMKGMRG